jgi:hypothetical protein
MSLFSILKSYQPLYPLVFILLLPSLVRYLGPILGLTPRTQPGQPSNPNHPHFSPSPSTGARSAPWPAPLKTLLVAYATYHFSLVIWPPYDLFTSNRLPILTPNDKLRRAVLARLQLSSPTPPGIDSSIVQGDVLSPVVELLLQRLQSLDNRYTYARLGHATMLECIWCTSTSDYFVAFLPSLIARCIGLYAILGLMGLPLVSGRDATKRAERWRAVFTWAIGALALAELSVRYAWELRAVEGDCTHVRMPLVVLLLSPH